MNMRTRLAATLLLMASSNLALAQDAENGEGVFKKYLTCHQAGPKAKNFIGPILNGIVARRDQ